MNIIQSLTLLTKTISPYALIFICLFSPKVRQDVVLIVITASCALIAPNEIRSDNKKSDSELETWIKD